MDLIEILLKIVLPVTVAVFIYLKKREIRQMLSNFSSTAEKSQTDTNPDIVAEKLDAILRHYNE